MKQLFIISVCLLSLATNQFARAQTCHAGTITALHNTACQGTPAQLTVAGSSGNIQWQSATTDTFANINGATDTLFRTAPLQQNTYFRVVVSNGSCADTSTLLRMFVPLPIVPYFTTSQTGDSSITFNSDSSKGSIAHYRWDFGDGNTSNENNPVHNYANDTTYYACLTLYDSFNCSYTYCRYIAVGFGNQNPPCPVVFSYYSVGGSVYFNSSGSINGDWYFWDFGDSTMSEDINPIHVYKSSGTYNVCLSVRDFHYCNGGVCHEVSVGVNAVKSISSNAQPLLVYPNPCADCEIKGVENPNELLVTDLLGRVVPVSFSKQSNGYRINFTSAGAGMYLIENIRTGEVVKVVRE